MHCGKRQACEFCTCTFSGLCQRAHTDYELVNRAGVAPAVTFMWSRFVTQAFARTDDRLVARPAAALLITLVLIGLPEGAAAG